MSATVDRGALATFDNPTVETDFGLSEADRTGPLLKRLTAQKMVSEITLAADGKRARQLASRVVSEHRPGTLTLAILNTVADAQAVHEAVVKAAPAADVILLHSRFRRSDRARLDKLALLAAIAFGTKVSFDAVELEGIGAISIDDINLAADMGYRIKLLGVAQMTGRGLEQRMTPCLVPADSPLGQLQGGTNMVVLEGDSVGQIVLRGPGAGMGPTASAVMGDVIDIARGQRMPTFGQPAITLATPQAAKSSTPASYYLRMTLLDKPGALAKIATCLGEAGVSIDQMRQYGHKGANAPVLIVTHKATRDDIDHAAARFAATGVLVGAPVVLRIEEV